jgi:lipoate-protein ligase A
MEMMDLEAFKEKLKSYKKSDIIFTSHAKIRALGRGIDLEEVRENIVNPIKLVYAKKLEEKHPDEEKFECYFNYSKLYSHKYVLTLNRKVIIITIISINRDWQRMVK